MIGKVVGSELESNPVDKKSNTNDVSEDFTKAGVFVLYGERSVIQNTQSDENRTVFYSPER